MDFFFLASFSFCFAFPEMLLPPSRGTPCVSEASMADAGLNHPHSPKLHVRVGKVVWSSGGNHQFWNLPTVY